MKLNKSKVISNRGDSNKKQDQESPETTAAINSGCMSSEVGNSKSTGGKINANNRIKVAGLRFSNVTILSAAELIVQGIEDGEGGVVVTPNLDIARLSKNDPWLRQYIEDADLVTADGSMIVLASHIQRTPVPERVAGSDLSIALCEHLSKTNFSVFLLGGDPGVASRAAEKLRSIYPNLNISGLYTPAYGFEKNAAEIALIEKSLEAANPNLILVGLGCPKQEKLISSLRGVFPNAWWIGVGITFSFISGDVHRAPLIVQKVGCEWLWRLLQEPKRLAKRHLVYGIPFAAEVMSKSAYTGIRNGYRNFWITSPKKSREEQKY